MLSCWSLPSVWRIYSVSKYNM